MCGNVNHSVYVVIQRLFLYFDDTEVELSNSDHRLDDDLSFYRTIFQESQTLSHVGNKVTVPCYLGYFVLLLVLRRLNPLISFHHNVGQCPSANAPPVSTLEGVHSGG